MIGCYNAHCQRLSADLLHFFSVAYNFGLFIPDVFFFSNSTIKIVRPYKKIALQPHHSFFQ